jgi:osmotically-inducible protein OsmY
MEKNEELQKNVQDAIKWEPALNGSEIEVTVKNGVVTLIGFVDSYSNKIQVENAVRNVNGVKAIIEKIEIKFDEVFKKTDIEIVDEILNTFKWNLSIPRDKITVKVEGGLVTLDGEINFQYQKEATKKSIENISGIIGIVNNVIIKTKENNIIEKTNIERAISRNWTLHNQNITINVVGNKVVLNGTVNSFYQKYDAGCIVWNAPGVLAVENELEIEVNF